MSIKVGICGVGQFADCFIPLFKAHPEVSKVMLCDIDAKKLKAKSKEFQINDTCPSLDELCQTDVDAIAIFTQHHIHGPQAVKALTAGKHVYSAVPSAISIEEITSLVKAVEQTGSIYMIGETSYYYPCAIYCRERFRKGDFGHIVYSEGQYFHDYIHGMYEVAQNRHGDQWQQYFGMPPMFYPTHSTSMIISVTGAYATHVCGMGFVDRHEDNLYAREDNVWKNPFSNETMLCKMSDGSTARINEFRRIGYPGEVWMSMYGTAGSYEEQYNSRIWVTAERDKYTDLSPQLAAREDKIKHEDGQEVGGDWLKRATAPIHPVHLLPKEYEGLTNGHHGSHQFLIHEFVSSCINKTQPANNVWQAARYLIPGLIAHESAMAGGVLKEVPDLGNPSSISEEHIT